jgi:hypothetical protein
MRWGPARESRRLFGSPAGCLIWLLALVVLLLLLSVLFGGFQKGTKAGEPAPPRPSVTQPAGPSLNPARAT